MGGTQQSVKREEWEEWPRGRDACRDAIKRNESASRRFLFFVSRSLFFFSYFQRCFVVGPTSERALARFLVRLTSRYRFSQWMGRGRFFPCRDGTKETTRTRPLFARRRKASGPSARSAGLVGEFLLSSRDDFFFSSPRSGGDSSRPPSSHKKRSVVPNASPFFRLVLGAATLRPAPSSVFSESITRTSSSFGPSFGSRRRRKKSFSSTPRFVRLASGCLIPSVRLLIRRETRKSVSCSSMRDGHLRAPPHNREATENKNVSAARGSARRGGRRRAGAFRRNPPLLLFFATRRARALSRRRRPSSSFGRYRRSRSFRVKRSRRRLSIRVARVQRQYTAGSITGGICWISVPSSCSILNRLNRSS